MGQVPVISVNLSGLEKNSGFQITLPLLRRALAALTYGNINKVALRRFDAWIGVSDGMRQLLISRGFDPQRIFPLYNGVDFSTPLKTVPRDEWLRGIGLTLTDRTVVFGIAARISPVKDMTTLVRAFAAAVKQAPDIRLVIAGDGEQAGEIRALAKELCPEGTVFFPGWLEDVNSFYQALDVNVLTSLSETFPYALTEGARMHCATIASNVGGVPYLIDDGENGLLFEPQDVSALTAHMLTLATDAAKRRGMGEALYEKTKRDFSAQAMVEKQKHYYEIIIRRFRRPKLERDGVVICGAYGKGNGGDNAILDAIVAQLRHIDPDLPICALSRTPKETRAAACVDSLYTFRLLSSITFRASAWPPARAAASCSMAAASAPSRARATANAPPKRSTAMPRSSPCATATPRRRSAPSA